MLESSCVIAISLNCPNLTKLSLEWCVDVGDEAIALVIKRCKKLIKLDCTGLKRLTDRCLTENIDAEENGQVTGLRSLRFLSF